MSIILDSQTVSFECAHCGRRGASLDWLLTHLCGKPEPKRKLQGVIVSAQALTTSTAPRVLPAPAPTQPPDARALQVYDHRYCWKCFKRLTPKAERCPICGSKV